MLIPIGILLECAFIANYCGCLSVWCFTPCQSQLIKWKGAGAKSSHSRCGTIKILPCLWAVSAEHIGLNYDSIALCQNEECLLLRDRFLGWTFHTFQLTTRPKFLDYVNNLCKHFTSRELYFYMQPINGGNVCISRAGQ